MHSHWAFIWKSFGQNKLNGSLLLLPSNCAIGQGRSKPWSTDGKLFKQIHTDTSYQRKRHALTQVSTWVIFSTCQVGQVQTSTCLSQFLFAPLQIVLFTFWWLSNNNADCSWLSCQQTRFRWLLLCHSSDKKKCIALKLAANCITHSWSFAHILQSHLTTLCSQDNWNVCLCFSS